MENSTKFVAKFVLLKTFYSNYLNRMIDHKMVLRLNYLQRLALIMFLFFNMLIKKLYTRFSIILIK